MSQQKQEQSSDDEWGEIIALVVKGVAIVAAFVAFIFLIPGLIVFMGRQHWAEKPGFWFWGRLEPWRGLVAVVGIVVTLAVLLWSVGPVVQELSNGQNIVDVATERGWQTMVINVAAGIGLIPAALLVARPVMAQKVDLRRVDDVAQLERIERQRFVAADRKLAWRHGFWLGRDGDLRPRKRRKGPISGPVEVEGKTA